MSFEYKTGFEEISAAILEEQWIAVGARGFEPTIEALGRRGGNCLRIEGNLGSANSNDYFRVYSAGTGVIVFGAAVKVNDVGWELYFAEAATKADLHAYVTITSSSITVYDASGSSVGSYSQDFASDFIYLEIKLDCSGTFQVKLNEELVIDLAGSFDAGTGIVTHYGFGGRTVYNNKFLYLDDLYIDTDTWRGDLAILYWPPTSDNAVNFTPSTGTDNYALVDETPENDTDYNQSAVVGDADIYGHSSTFGSITGDVLAVDVIGRVNVPDGGVGSGIIPKLKLGGVEYSGTQIDGATITKENIAGEFLLNPATGAAFTQAELETLDGFGWEIGS